MIELSLRPHSVENGRIDYLVERIWRFPTNAGRKVPAPGRDTWVAAPI